jgi:protein ImuB
VLTDALAVLIRWGLRTLGDLAALPRGEVHARLGPLGVRLHQAACGEDTAPLVPEPPPEPWVDRVDLEWPIDGLEPLSFVLARQFERLSAALERADRGAVTIGTRLTLSTRETHVRILHLPAPMRDARVLRTLVLLDLESHPPAAGIDRVELALEVAPGRILQGSLLDRALPSAETLATLLARLAAVAGEPRVGCPAVLDTYDARRVALQPFRPSDPAPRRGGPAGRRPLLPPADARKARPADARGTGPAAAGGQIRRFRIPIPARVTVVHGTPVRVVPSTRDLRGGTVVQSAGPWRSSGAWWTLGDAGWDRDEWDLALTDGGVYRVTRQRATGRWDIEGAFD